MSNAKLSVDLPFAERELPKFQSEVELPELQSVVEAPSWQDALSALLMAPAPPEQTAEGAEAADMVGTVDISGCVSTVARFRPRSAVLLLSSRSHRSCVQSPQHAESAALPIPAPCQHNSLFSPFCRICRRMAERLRAAVAQFGDSERSGVTADGARWWLESGKEELVRASPRALSCVSTDTSTLAVMFFAPFSCCSGPAGHSLTTLNHMMLSS